MKDATNLLDHLRQFQRTGYGTGLPSALDSKFIELAKHYHEAAKADRKMIRGYVEDDTRLLLIGFSDRLATVAARTNDKQLLFFSLIAHSIEDLRHDDPENIIRLALIYHVAEKIGENPSRLFEDVAALSSESASKHMLSFIARPPELKSLRSMKIIEESTKDGVNYRYA